MGIVDSIDIGINVYIDSGNTVGYINFICGTYMDAFPISAHQLYGLYEQFGGIFVFGTYMVMSCEVNVVIGCDLSHIYTNVRSICLYRMRSVI